MNTPVYLQHDLVIPAGTKFDTAPTQTCRSGEGHVITSIGLSKDTSGDLVYFVGGPDSVEREQLRGIFSDIPPNLAAPISLEVLAEVLYEEYCEAVGGVAFNGDPLPGWTEFAADPNKEKQSKAWVATAAKAIELLKE